MNEDSYNDIISRDAEGFEIGQGLVQCAAGQAADTGQLVRRDALVWWCIHQVTHDVEKLLPPRAGNVGCREKCLSFLHPLDTQGGGEDLNPVFFAGQQLRFFEP